MADRLKKLSRDEMSPRQEQIYADIVSRRGGAGGPFLAWLRNPELADRAQKLGSYCRYDSCLPAKLSELAILVVGRHWRAQVEWAVHAPIAEKAGLDAAAIAAIKTGAAPLFTDAGEAVVFEYSRELLQSTRVGDDLHARAVALLGEAGVVDLVALIGYYGLVALTLNAFAVPVPDGYEIPFEE